MWLTQSVKQWTSVSMFLAWSTAIFDQYQVLTLICPILLIYYLLSVWYVLSENQKSIKPRCQESGKPRWWTWNTFCLINILSLWGSIWFRLQLWLTQLPAKQRVLPAAIPNLRQDSCSVSLWFAEVDCGSPPARPHSKILWNKSSRMGSKAVYECNSGYHNVGKGNVSTCTAAGRWKEPHVLCQGTVTALSHHCRGLLYILYIMCLYLTLKFSENNFT